MSSDDTTVTNAQIGVASKDLSIVNVKNLSLVDCNQGFAAYRKKPEFGGGQIFVESYKEKNVERLINKDDESQISMPK